MDGRIKPLLTRPDGRALVTAIEETIEPHCQETFVVVTDEVRGPIEAAVRSPIVVDRGDGPTGALFEAARRVGSPWLLLVGGDHPHPSIETVRALYASAGDTCDAVAVRLDGFGQTLWALYRREALLQLEDPPRSLFGVLTRLSTRWVEGCSLSPTARAVFEDVDTPEDARRYGLG